MSNLQYSSDEASSAESTPLPSPHLISESFQQYSPGITTRASNPTPKPSFPNSNNADSHTGAGPEKSSVKDDSNLPPSQPTAPPPYYFPAPVSGTEKTTTNNLRDREQRLIAELLSKFKDIVDLTRNREGSEESSDERLTAATQAYQIEVKTVELIKSAEDLLALTRQLKEMWAFGKLRGVGEGEEEGQLEEDAKEVGTMIEKIMSKNYQDKA